MRLRLLPLALPMRRLPLEVACCELDNGLQVLFLPEDRLPLVAVRTLYRAAGSRRDPPGRCGLAHLCEHLAFSAGGPAVQRLGASARAATSHDHAAFSQLVPARGLEVALAVERRRMSLGQDGLAGDLLEAQRRVLLREVRHTAASSRHRAALERIFALLFPPPHPYGRPPMGTLVGIASAGKGDCEDFIRSGYCPDRAVLVLVGGFELAAAVATVERLFGDLPPSGPAVGREAFAARAGTAAAEDPPESVAACAYLGFRFPGCWSPGWEHGSILLHAMAVGRSSLLWTSLIQSRRLAVRVEAFLIGMQEASGAAVALTPMPGVPAREVAAAALEALAGLAERGIGAEDLARAARNAIKQHWARFDFLEQRAELLALATLWLGGPGRVADVGERLGRATAGEVTAAGARAAREHVTVVCTEGASA